MLSLNNRMVRHTCTSEKSNSNIPFDASQIRTKRKLQYSKLQLFLAYQKIKPTKYWRGRERKNSKKRKMITTKKKMQKKKKKTKQKKKTEINLYKSTIDYFFSFFFSLFCYSLIQLPLSLV